MVPTTLPRLSGEASVAARGTRICATTENSPVSAVPTCRQQRHRNNQHPAFKHIAKRHQEQQPGGVAELCRRHDEASGTGRKVERAGDGVEKGLRVIVAGDGQTRCHGH